MRLIFLNCDIVCQLIRSSGVIWSISEDEVAHYTDNCFLLEPLAQVVTDCEAHENREQTERGGHRNLKQRQIRAD